MVELNGAKVNLIFEELKRLLEITGSLDVSGAIA
jgi:hypothetical protein